VWPPERKKTERGKISIGKLGTRIPREGKERENRRGGVNHAALWAVVLRGFQRCGGRKQKWWFQPCGVMGRSAEGGLRDVVEWKTEGVVSTCRLYGPQC